MTKLHKRGSEPLDELDIPEVTCVDAEGNVLWSGYLAPPVNGINTIYDAPEQAVSASRGSSSRKRSLQPYQPNGQQAARR